MSMDVRGPLGVLGALLLSLSLLGCEEVADEQEDAGASVDELATANGGPGEEERELREVENAEVGALAPNFTLVGSDGQEYTLEDYRGQWVILEWINHDCPFVRKFYDVGKMQELQERYTDEGAAWLSIASSAPGNQGHESPERWNELTEQKGALPEAVLIDEEGEVGQTYGARTTPQMYVISPEGELIYNGAIDSIPTANSDDIDEADNYLVMVMEAVLAGEEPPVRQTDPYGCAVHY